MDDDDSYIFCGTSLPDPEDDPGGEKRARRALQVRDEKGRQRFHGAFTGGFSAGYFNTVGTKEGWTPSTFVSSRSKAAERVEQQPEDFMDAEDFSEFGIAPKKIHTTSKFRDGTSSGKRKAPMYSDTVIPGEPPLKELVQPVAESIGIQILMKMGWKPGQGIGPRVKRHSKRFSGADETSASQDSPSETDDPMRASFTFAPKDTTTLPYAPKDDYHGIGYTGLSTKSVLSTAAVGTSDVTKSWLEKSKKKLLISGKAFGIGALEDDDDVDIYGHEDMSQYDFSELPENQKTKETERSARGSNYGFDGVLDGFIKSEKNVTVRKRFRLPELPKGYVPVHRSACASKESGSSTSKPQVLTAEDRSLILGERKLITMAFKNTSSLAPKPFTPAEQRPATGSKAVSSGFQPFINDTEKQKRYEQYLKLEHREHIKTLQPANMTEWEKQQEVEEFARAAALYQPLSNMLNSRFVSRTHLEVEKQGGIIKVEKSSPEKVIPSGPTHEKTKWYPASLLCKRFNIPNPYPNSSSVGVPNSGKKQKFLFDSLYFESDSKQTTSTELQEASQEEEAIPSVKVESEESPGSKVEDPRVANLIDLASEEIAPGVNKPPMDLFKAIFENTSDEDDQDSSHSDQSDGEDEKEESSSSKQPVTDVPSQKDSAPAPTLPAKDKAPKKAFGVFANIDFDMLNSSHVDSTDVNAASHGNAEFPDTSTSSVSFSKEKDGKQQLEEVSVIPSDSVYGPRLPPSGFTPTCSESKIRSHKHSTRKEKHKHHKHKKKKKKKKKQKKQSLNKEESPESSSIDSGSSDGDDIDPSIIIKKLNDLHNKSAKKYCKY